MIITAPNSLPTREGILTLFLGKITVSFKISIAGLDNSIKAIPANTAKAGAINKVKRTSEEAKYTDVIPNKTINISFSRNLFVAKYNPNIPNVLNTPNSKKKDAQVAGRCSATDSTNGISNRVVGLSIVKNFPADHEIMP